MDLLEFQHGTAAENFRIWLVVLEYFQTKFLLIFYDDVEVIVPRKISPERTRVRSHPRSSPERYPHAGGLQKYMNDKRKKKKLFKQTYMINHCF